MDRLSRWCWRRGQRFICLSREVAVDVHRLLDVVMDGWKVMSSAKNRLKNELVELLLLCLACLSSSCLGVVKIDLLPAESTSSTVFAER